MALKNNWANGDVFTPAAANDMANAVNLANLSKINVTDPAYGAVGDAVALTDLALSNGSRVCTSASNLFTASMVGKAIIVAGAAGSGNPLVSTVASYQSAGQITLSTTATGSATVYGGPNVNAVIGTDNSSAFATAFTAAAAKAAAASSYRKRYENVTAVYVPGGSYLTLTGVSALQVAGISVVGAGMRSTRIWHCGTDAFLQMGTFNASQTNAWYGESDHLWVRDLSLACPLLGTPRGIGIQDNGSGDLYLDNVYVKGFTYGVYATSGSDFSRFGPNLQFDECTVGLYLGPRSQQVLIQGTDFLNCGEGLVNEGAPQGVIVGCSFVNNSTADITYDGVSSGSTRAGMNGASLGAGYGGSWIHTGCWFESGSGGVTTRNCNQHVWIKSTGDAVGWQGLQFQSCYLVSGGRAQVVGGTNAFISDAGTVAANPIVDGLSVRGSSVNALYYYYGAASTSAAVFTNTFRQAGSSTVADNVGTKYVANVNTISLESAVTGDSPQVKATGPDTNVNLILRPQGTSGYVGVYDNGGNNTARFQRPASGTPINYVRFTSATTTNPILITAVSNTDTNVSINLVPKGAGTVQQNGVDVVTTGGALGTPSSGTLTNCTFPTLNQNTTGSAATLTTGRTVQTSLSSTTASTFDGSANITPGVSGTLAVGNGGTGQTTAAAAITALTGTQTSGRYLRSDGTNAALAAIVAADVPTLNQNTTGTASNVTGTVAVANGGTGVTTVTGLLKGNGTSAFTAAAAGTDYVSPSGTETLTSKTLTSPKVNELLDADGDKTIVLSSSASAVNYLQVSGAAAGDSTVQLLATGTDSTVNLSLRPKSTSGYIAIVDSGANNLARFQGPASGTAINYWRFNSAATGNAVTATAVSNTDTNVSINLVPKAAGTVQANGNPVGVKVAVPATATSTGALGQWAADSSWLYICTATDTWCRVAIATW